MRVSELAGVAGVSVRTIRHYHAIGLMPVPPRAGAWRDYGVDDAARLLRIRALADAGIALSDMPALVEEGFDLIETFGPLPRALTKALEVFAMDRFAHALVVAAFPTPSQGMYVDMAFEDLPRRFAAARAAPARTDPGPSDSSRPDSTATR